MKIGVIVGRFPVISEQFILNHIVGLLESGHDVTIISARTGDYHHAHPMVQDWGMAERHLSARVPRSFPARALRALAIVLRLLPVAPVAVVRALNVWRYRTAVFSGKTLFFYAVLRRHRFDVLHCHFGPNGLSGAYLKRCGITEHLVTHFHGSDINTYPRRYGATVYRHLFHEVDRIVCNTSFTAGKVVAHGADQQQISIVPESLLTRDYPQRSDPPPQGDNDPFVVLTVGRMVEKKGHRYVLDALVRVMQELPTVQYRMVGDGPLRAELVSYAEQIGVAPVCTFLGAQTGLAVTEEYCQCHVFILASVTASNGDMEGQGLVLQEAQSMGIPVISTIHNGIPDGVLDGETGLLVPERDSDALAAAILTLARDTGLRQRMGVQGARFVRERYDTTVVTSKLNGVYAALNP